MKTKQLGVEAVAELNQRSRPPKKELQADEGPVALSLQHEALRYGLHQGGSSEMMHEKLQQLASLSWSLWNRSELTMGLCLSSVQIAEPDLYYIGLRQNMVIHLCLSSDMTLVQDSPT